MKVAVVGSRSIANADLRRYIPPDATLIISGGAVGVAFALWGALMVPAVMIGALQLVWCLYLYLRAKHTFKHKKDTGNS